MNKPLEIGSCCCHSLPEIICNYFLIMRLSSWHASDIWRVPCIIDINILCTGLCRYSTGTMGISWGNRRHMTCPLGSDQSHDYQQRSKSVRDLNEDGSLSKLHSFILYSSANEIFWYILQLMSRHANPPVQNRNVFSSGIGVNDIRYPGRFDSRPGGRLNKKDGLTRYGDSHVKDKTS